MRRALLLAALIVVTLGEVLMGREELHITMEDL